MTTLALKNIPDDLYQRLEKVASAKRRSLDEEALQALEKGVEQEESTTASDGRVDIQGLHEHAHVQVTVREEKKDEHPLDSCIGIMSDEDAERIKQIIEAEFERIEPDEWK